MKLIAVKPRYTLLRTLAGVRGGRRARDSTGRSYDGFTSGSHTHRAYGTEQLEGFNRQYDRPGGSARRARGSGCAYPAMNPAIDAACVCHSAVPPLPRSVLRSYISRHAQMYKPRSQHDPITRRAAPTTRMRCGRLSGDLPRRGKWSRGQGAGSPAAARRRRPGWRGRWHERAPCDSK